MHWEFTDHGASDLAGSFLLVTVPVTRNVSRIVSSALLQDPRRELVATVNSDRMPPVSMAFEGVVSGPMHAWRIPGPAGPRRACPDLVLFASDIRLSAEALMGFCGALARWAKERKVACAMSIEGADADEFPPEPTLALTHAGEGRFDELGLDLYEGVHAGMNAAFLARFNQHGIPAAGLFAPTARDVVSEANAAIAALAALAPILPPGVGKGGFEKVARSLAEMVERAQAEQESAARDLAAQSRHDPGYV